jgi:hypothetical protein
LSRGYGRPDSVDDVEQRTDGSMTAAQRIPADPRM